MSLSLFVFLIAEELDDNTGHLKILLATLKPDWLKVKVLQNLLDFYDTALLPTCAILEVAPPLDLARITGYYLYMLPPVTQPAENVPASPHKKSGTSRRYVTSQPGLRLRRPIIAIH